MSATSERASLQMIVRGVIQKARITQGEFSSATGIDYQRVRSITAGRIAKLKFEEVLCISKLYRVNPEWLISGLGKSDLSSSNKMPIRAVSADASSQLLHHLKQAMLCMCELVNQLERTA